MKSLDNCGTGRGWGGGGGGGGRQIQIKKNATQNLTRVTHGPSSVSGIIKTYV